MTALRLEGTPNFRDLGGLKASDGRVVRRGLLFRTEGPSNLTASDRELLRKLRLRLVCDLRSARELGRAADDSYADCCANILNLDVAADLRVVGNEAIEKLRRSPTIESAREAMQWNYQSMTKVMGPHLAVLADRILTHDDLPMMVHCEAGKDRTGVALALLLAAIDVRRDEILSDYLRSNDSLVPGRFVSVTRMVERTLGFVPSEEFMHALILTHPSYLQAAFDDIAASWGSLDAYLEREAGLDGQRRVRLQTILLEPLADA